MGGGGPHPEVSQDLLDHLGVFDAGDEPHWSRTPRADERVHLIDLRDQPRPGALRGRRGDFAELHLGMTIRLEETVAA